MTMVHALRLTVIGAMLMATGCAGRHRAPDFSAAERAIEAAIGRHECPGAVLLVGRRSGVIYEKAFGNRAVAPAVEAMTADTIFDLASLTKPVATATAVMILIDRGKIDPHERVAAYLPQFGNHGKEPITVEQLLLHCGGLTPDNAIEDYADGPARAWERIFQLGLESPPGAKFAYTDVGYIVLGKLVEAVDGRPLDRFAAEEIFETLGMNDAGYHPPADRLPRCAPTQQREGRWMRGEVHDPRAYALGGVAGHAGVFATAQDLARYCRMMLGGGALDGRRVLSSRAVSLMAGGRAMPDGAVRSYGFDVKTAYSAPLGERFPALKSFGHTGFTGTCFWIDPADDLFFVLLTNAVHADGKGKVVALRRAVSTAVATAVLGPENMSANGDLNTLCGIDVIKRDGFRQLDGRRAAIVTNQTGLDRQGNRTIDLVKAACGENLLCIFSPEHGLFGTVDEKVGHTVDAKTGLKVSSLYGETRRPTDEMLTGIDTILFDIQDVGTRFYTYPATMAYCMEAAARRRLRMIVLDRPNPIGGERVDGPIADAKHFGFTACGPLPLVHGLTIGELARLFNAEYGIGCDLTVVPCENYSRSMTWDRTGLTWVNPSPNLRDLTEATLYPAVALLEATNVSVGRGTDRPFEQFGAPWVDGRRLAASLNEAHLPGLRFIPAEFTPVSSKHEKIVCHGCQILMTDRTRLEPARSGLTIAWHLRKQCGDVFDIEGMLKLLQNDAAMAGLKSTDHPEQLETLWNADVERFRHIRERYLLYR